MTEQQQNPYAPPSTTSSFRASSESSLDGADLDLQLAQTQLTFSVKAAIGTVAGTGALLILGALQLWDTTRLYGWLWMVPYAMLFLGAGCVAVSIKIYRQKFWAVLAGLVLTLLSALGMAGWFLIAASSGYLSPIPLLTPVIGILAAVCTGLAIGPCRRSALARRRLAASGIPIDF